MASVTALPSGARPEHRGLVYWMDCVLKELERLHGSPDADTVHDLRVAIRRCRSVASVVAEVDPHPAWREMRKVARKLFHKLGGLRDVQVMEEWVRHLSPESDSLRAVLLANLESELQSLRESALEAAEQFDTRAWKRLSGILRQRLRFVPPGGLAAECLALERYQEAKELQANALRTEKPKPWHALRIGLKRFRYTVESLLPEHHAAWSENLKRVQDLLGDVHDLDVLSGMVKEASSGLPQSRETLLQTIEHERHERIEKYRQLTLGKTGLWNQWRHALPHGERLEAAAMARLRATARASDAHSRRSALTARIALALHQKLGRLKAGPAFVDPSATRIFRAAAFLHTIAPTDSPKGPHKSARKYLASLPVPPGWSTEDWELLAAVVRYHRGAEPRTGRGPFGQLSETQQKNLRALAGTLRLARALRKSGVNTTAGLRVVRTNDAIILRARGVSDSAESAVRLAAGKHLLEGYLEFPLLIKAAQVQQKLFTMPAPERGAPPLSAA
jgi:CHAD domain-containing protein